MKEYLPHGGDDTRSSSPTT